MTAVIPGQPVRAEPQMRNCASGNLEIRGRAIAHGRSMLSHRPATAAGQAKPRACDAVGLILASLAPRPSRVPVAHDGGVTPPGQLDCGFGAWQAKASAVGERNVLDRDQPAPDRNADISARAQFADSARAAVQNDNVIPRVGSRWFQLSVIRHRATKACIYVVVISEVD
jgi:hypothetical protein